MAPRRVGVLATRFDAICVTKGKVERFIRYLREVALSIRLAQEGLMSLAERVGFSDNLPKDEVFCGFPDPCASGAAITRWRAGALAG